MWKSYMYRTQTVHRHQEGKYSKANSSLSRQYDCNTRKDTKIVSMIRKYHKLQTNPWHREEEPHNNHEAPGRQLSKATSSLFPIKMTAKLEWAQSNAQQNIEQLQNPTIAVTTTTNQQQQNHRVMHSKTRTKRGTHWEKPTTTGPPP